MANYTNEAPAFDAAAVTPSDTGDLGNCRSVYVGGAGNMKVDTRGGTTVTFSGIPAGTTLQIMVTRVYSTDTTATNIVALY